MEVWPVGDEADGTELRGGVADALLAPLRSEGGVPARAAHPGRSGPLVVHAAIAITASTLPTPASTRVPARAGHPEVSRQPIAASTAATQTTVRTIIHPR